MDFECPNVKPSSGNEQTTTDTFATLDIVLGMVCGLANLEDFHVLHVFQPQPRSQFQFQFLSQHRIRTLSSLPLLHLSPSRLGCPFCFPRPPENLSLQFLSCHSNLPQRRHDSRTRLHPRHWDDLKVSLPSLPTHQVGPSGIGLRVTLGFLIQPFPIRYLKSK